MPGVRVIEMGQLIVGPFAGKTLGEFGADVGPERQSDAATPQASSRSDTIARSFPIARYADRVLPELGRRPGCKMGNAARHDALQTATLGALRSDRRDSRTGTRCQELTTVRDNLSHAPISTTSIDSIATK